MRTRIMQLKLPPPMSREETRRELLSLGIPAERLPEDHHLWDFRRVSLKGAELYRFLLADCNLMDVDMEGANLECAVLAGAMLQGCNMQGAWCTGAQMDEADLTNADLTRAHLRYAVLRGALLRGAVLTKTVLVGTNLEGAKSLTAHQLAQCVGLEKAILDVGLYADAVAAGYKPKS